MLYRREIYLMPPHHSPMQRLWDCGGTTFTPDLARRFAFAFYGVRRSAPRIPVESFPRELDAALPFRRCKSASQLCRTRHAVLLIIRAYAFYGVRRHYAALPFRRCKSASQLCRIRRAVLLIIRAYAFFGVRRHYAALPFTRGKIESAHYRTSSASTTYSSITLIRSEGIRITVS